MICDSFSLHNFKLLAFILITTIVSGAWINRAVLLPDAAEIPAENRFRKVVLTLDITDPTDMAIIPDGRVLLTELQGAVKIYNPSKNKIITAGRLAVANTSASGLLGIVLDPQFKLNQWVYLFYSPLGKEVNYLSRFTLTNDSLSLKSEKIILQIPDDRAGGHAGAGLTFDSKGLLYISTGDNTNPTGTHYAPLDERPGRENFDAQRTAANTQDLRGKILRIKPLPNGTYAIPLGNLFTNRQQGRTEIYAMGCRNPFKITVDQRTNYLYWGDTGPDASDDNPQGPRGYDELNQTRQAGNYGWPYVIAENQAYAQVNFTDNTAGAKFKSAAPINNSVNNTGLQNLPPAQKPLIWYPYDQSTLFPELGSGGRSLVVGSFYYFDAKNPSPIKFPAYYNGTLFLGEWMRNWVKVVHLNKQDSLQQIQSFMPATSFAKPISLKFGPDGALYVLEYGSLWHNNTDSRLSRIEYVSGNRPPVARIIADKTSGAVPLRVKLNGRSSEDYDQGDVLTYAWTFGNGIVQSNKATPEFTFNRPGIYPITLTVKDKAGKKSATTIKVKAGNSIPQLSIQTKHKSKFYGDTVQYTVQVIDAEDGNLAQGSIESGRVSVQLEHYPDANIILNTKGHIETPHFRGSNWIAESDCKSCHAPDAKSVGPSFKAIAQRYQARQYDYVLIDQLTDKIQKGGAGNWGRVNMTAHPQLSKDAATEMVKFILALNQPMPPAQPLATQGYFTTGLSSRGNTNTYVLTAFYSDTGSKNSRPLHNQASLVLRSPRILPPDFDEVYEAQKKDILTNINKDGYACLKNIDLTGIKSITYSLATERKETAIELHLDSPTGKLLSTTAVPAGKLKSWQLLTAPLPVLTGMHHIYLVFKNRAHVQNLLELQWVHLNTR